MEYPLAASRINRGMGAAEFARAIRQNKPSRMDAQLGLHVIEIMEAIHTSAANGEPQPLTTTVKRPAPFI
jgi:predicted dehydrogenase